MVPGSILNLSTSIRIEKLRLNSLSSNHWSLLSTNSGQSLVIPPFFDGTNYAYWKLHVRAWAF